MTEAERHLEQARRHLAERRWEAARASFEDSLEANETPDALEGLGWAAWWLDDAEAVFAARERAFRLYRERREPAAAARMAIWLAADELDFRGAVPVAEGWIARAARLLEPMDPRPEHGWLAFHQGYLAFIRGDTAACRELAARTAEVGRDLGVTDLEMLGLALEGAALVSCAEVERGMRLLDEATAAAVAGEASVPIAGAWTCCFLVSACAQVRDLPRALQWCGRIADFARRYGSRYMLGFCRAYYGEVYLWGGRWREAEDQLEGAVEAYAASRPPLVPGALVGLAELRCRQGRWDEAEELLDEAGPAGNALLCRARIALDRGEALRAAELAERCLRRLSEERRLERAPALEVLIRARAERADAAGAAAALEELRAVADAVGTALLRAGVELCDGVLAAARSDHPAARRFLEDAADRFERNGCPYDAARARTELAKVLGAMGRDELARREAEAALAGFGALGSRSGVRRAEAVLAAGTATPSAGARPDPPLPELTPREREVLRHVSEGITNREIAERLFISEHTVHRHVTNLLRKLGLPSRAAAAARAARAGLLEETEP